MTFARNAGFTLIELTVALVLMALMSAVLYGSLSLSADSWNRGEAKTDQTAQMRLGEEFLRKTLTAQFPLRMHKSIDQRLYFTGASDSLAYAAALPGRAGGGMYYFRLAVTPVGNQSKLTLARAIPDYAATTPPDFANADFSSLADGVAEVKLGYFGRDAGVADVTPPTWRDRWEDPQMLPMLIRVDVKPVKGAPWPPLIVEPRLAPDAGCTTWDAASRRCTG